MPPKYTGPITPILIRNGNVSSSQTGPSQTLPTPEEEAVAKCRALVGKPGALHYVQDALKWAEDEWEAGAEAFLTASRDKARKDREDADRALTEAETALIEFNQKKRKSDQ